MNARNCQLCGKPLSRLRVGGDGDFCCKEHRNQYRLRAGMDRLVEVNKVASLMRRRESARQIPFAALIRGGARERHGFSNLLPQAVTSPPAVRELRLSSAQPRLAAPGSGCIPQQPVPAAGTRQQPRTNRDGIPIMPGKSVAPRLRVRHTATREVTARGEIRALGGIRVDMPSQARDCRQLPAAPVRSHVGGIASGLRRGGPAVMGVSAGVRRLPLSPVEGANLRVSIGLGFRLPALRPPAYRALPEMAASLERVDRPRLPACGCCIQPGEEKDLTVAMPAIPAVLPAAPGRQQVLALGGRSDLLPGQRMLLDMPQSEARGSDLAWIMPQPDYRGAAITQNSAGFARRNGAHLFGLPLRARRVDVPQHEGQAPFSVRDDVFLPSVPYFNVLAAATVPADVPPEPPVAAPTPVPDRPRLESVRYEEHFDSGWDNWVGGVEDWKVDVAGVRTGSLALYLPSLELSDYDLEFLTRIDSRTVAWVVRATGANTHLRCSVTAVEGDMLEFGRTLVRDGSAEAVVTSPVRAPGKPRRTFTVRMSVTGPVFSITIDGKTIETWVDDRLATGGIGFTSAADDRARLYWVRVCSPGTPSKEQIIQ